MKIVSHCDKCGKIIAEMEFNKEAKIIKDEKYSRRFIAQIYEHPLGSSINPGIFIDSLVLCAKCVTKLRYRGLHLDVKC